MNERLKQFIDENRKARELVKTRFSRLGDLIVKGTDDEFREFLDELSETEGDELLREPREDKTVGGDIGVTDA